MPPHRKSLEVERPSEEGRSYRSYLAARLTGRYIRGHDLNNKEGPLPLHLFALSFSTRVQDLFLKTGYLLTLTPY